jgi:hypothetical protein
LGEGEAIHSVVPTTKAIQRFSDLRQPHATIIELEEERLAAMRVLSLGRDLITLTYVAPDFLFEAKPALELLDRIAHSIELSP